MANAASISIGKIVNSNSHVDYVCQVFGRRETAQPIEPAAYALGSFVAIALEEGAWRGGRLVGVVYNTMLVNPDFGSLGPRLSPRTDLTIVSPDLFDETATLVGIVTVGWQPPQGKWQQGMPAIAATVNNTVQTLSDEEIVAFHLDAQKRLVMRYVPLLLAQNSPLVQPLLVTMADDLKRRFPAQARRIDLLRNQLAWKSIVQPAA
jgi:hypothetical protein